MRVTRNPDDHAPDDWSVLYCFSRSPPGCFLGTDLSMATRLLTTDHHTGWSPPWLLCHLIHVSPCEWSTWLSAADVIDYRWPTGSIMNHNLCRNTRTKQKSYSTWPIIQDPKWIINFIHLFKWLRRQLCFNETLAYTRLLPWTVVFGYGWMVIHQFMY